MTNMRRSIFFLACYLTYVCAYVPLEPTLSPNCTTSNPSTTTQRPITTNNSTTTQRSTTPIPSTTTQRSTTTNPSTTTEPPTPAPPSPDKVPEMARYIIHNTDWISLATISTLDGVEGYPFANLKSLSDGPRDNGTGVPYLLLTDLDISGQDVLVNNKVSIMATMAETGYCQKSQYDPQDPRCSRLLITGKLVKVPKNTDEYAFAKSSLFTRHPAMKMWVKVHNFYVAKIEIIQVIVLDFFGGAKFVTPEDYYNVNTTRFSYRNYQQPSVQLL